MPAWLGLVTGLIKPLIDKLGELWAQHGEKIIAYLKGRQDQKQKDRIAGLEDALDRQRETSEAARDIQDETKDRVVDRDWLEKKPRGRWKFWVIAVVFLSGCGAVAGRSPRVLPPVASPVVRPALADASCLPEPWMFWLGSLIRAYEVNCAVLKTERGEDPATCEVK